MLLALAMECRSSAFTIVELIVVIVVIGILSLITIISYTNITNRAIVSSLQSNLINASRQLKLYQVDYGNFPTSLDANRCPVPADTNRCLKPNSGNTYTYQSSVTSPQIFCLSAVSGTQNYNITQEGVPSPGICPTLYYDAGVAVSYPKTGVTVTDLSGNAMTGTLTNGVNYSTAKGGAFDFDGVNDYLGSGAITPLTSYSAEAWIKADKLTGGNADQNSLGFTVMSVSSNYALWVSVGGTVSSTEVKFRAFSSDASGHVTSGANLNTTDWFHIAVTATKNAGAKVYVNGVEKASFVSDDVAWAGTFTVGDLRPNRFIGFDGLITGVKVYGNRVLTATEVSENFNSTRARFGV